MNWSESRLIASEDGWLSVFAGALQMRCGLQ